MTYSTNFGNPAIEAINWNSLQTILEQLPDNTAQLISPSDVRDAIFTTWEQGVLKVITIGSENYIGTENGGTSSNFRYKMMFGKKELQPGNVVLNNSLLLSDTDIFIYNNKSDSNLSLQDTKMSFLAGDDFTSFNMAPYILAKKITGTSSNWIDLNLTNPVSNGVIQIDSDLVSLTSWVVDNINGSIYPTSSYNIGLTGVGNRVGTIYMNSEIDYLNTLNFNSGTSSIVFDNNGKIITNDLEVVNNLKFQITATSGYFLSNDGSGNAIWQPGKIDTVGVTQGFVSLSDGISGVNWIKPYGDATGITQGFLLVADNNTVPVFKSIDNIITSATAGYVLGSDGVSTKWISNNTGSVGGDGEIQFSTSGFLDSNPNLTYDNVNYVFSTIVGSFSNITSSNITSSSATFSNITSSSATFSNITSSNITSINATFSNITISSGSNGYVLTSDSIGNATWQQNIHTTSYGITNSVQLSDGLGGFTSSPLFTFGNSLLLNAKMGINTSPIFDLDIIGSFRVQNSGNDVIYSNNGKVVLGSSASFASKSFIDTSFGIRTRIINTPPPAPPVGAPEGHPIDIDDSIIMCDSTSISILTQKLTLPSSFSSNKGRILIIKDSKGFGATKNIELHTAVNMAGDAAYPVDGNLLVPTYVINTNYGFVMLVSDGLGWNIISKG